MSGCLFILLFTLLIAQTESGRQVITREEIRHAGLIRLNEIFILINDWQGASVDGFDWRMSANALGSIQDQHWIILLNGQRISLELLHSNNLNLLPISVEQIDSVIVLSVPQLAFHEFSDQGLIHFYSCQQDSGLALHGRLALGNEAGDPGPYRYTPYKTTNVDRAAHDDSYGLSYAAADLHLGLHQKNLVHYPTSEPMLNRVWYPLTGDDYPRIDVNTTFFDGRYKKQHWNMGYTSNRDHLFVKPMGREIPVNRTVYFGTINGALSENLFYSFFYQNNYLYERRNVYTLNFDRRIQLLQAQVRASFNHTAFGIGLEKQIFSSKHLTGDRENSHIKFSVSNTLAYNQHLRQTISALLLANSNFATIKAAVSHHYRVHKALALEGTVAYSERHHEETDDYYGLPPGWVSINTIDNNKKNRLLSVDVYSRLQVKSNLQAIFGMNYRQSFAHILQKQVFHYRPLSFDFEGPLTFYTRSSGETASLNISLNHVLGTQVRQEFFYQNRFRCGGEVPFENAWEAVSRHKFSYTLSFIPFLNASIWTKITWLSRTRWPDYSYIPQESDNQYQDLLSEIINWDLAVQKSIWKNRLRGSLVFRNLLNNRQVYHPVGAVFYLRFFVQVELDLHSFWMNNRKGTKALH
jgi:hypothetical protein